MSLTDFKGNYGELWLMVGMEISPGMEEVGIQMMTQQAYGKGDNIFF